jgi:hypothetical protein
MKLNDKISSLVLENQNLLLPHSEATAWGAGYGRHPLS